MNKKAPDGASLADHFKAAARQLGKPIAKPPKLRSGFLYLWEIFRELDSTRSVGFSGVCRLTYVDLDAYARLSGFPFDPWEVKAIMAMDEAVIAVKAGD